MQIYIVPVNGNVPNLVVVMGLNYYEKKLIKVLEVNPDINTRKFIKLAGLGKTTFYEYSDRLENAGYISYNKIKNERVWRITRRNEKHDLGLPDMDESEERLDKLYKEIEFKVLKSLQKIRRDNFSEKIDIYSNAILLVLSNLGSMKLISIYRNNGMPKSYAKFVKRLELLLEKISDSKFFSDYGFGRTAIDNIGIDAEEKLNKFLGIDPFEGKKVSIY